MKAIKFTQSQTNMNDWEYKAERQQQKVTGMRMTLRWLSKKNNFYYSKLIDKLLDTLKH